MMGKKNSRLGIFVLAIAMAFGVGRITFAQDKTNLIPNGGFERGEGESPSEWTFGYSGKPGACKGVWATDEVHSGKRSAKIIATEPARYGAGWGSPYIPVKGGSKLKVGAWVKIKDVVKGKASWHKMRFVLYTYDKEKKKIRHSDLACQDGTMDWTHYEAKINLAEEVAFICIKCMLSSCTGTVWFDDIEVKVIVANQIANIFKQINPKRAEKPVIFPKPWKIKHGTEQRLIQDVTIVTKSPEMRVEQALTQYLKDCNINYRTSENIESSNIANIVIVLADKKMRQVSQKAKVHFPGISFKDLGEQGYFLLTDITDEKTTIYLAANTEQGRFYAFQTMKQLLVKEDNNYYLTLTQIADRPTLSMRGTAMSQWLRSSRYPPDVSIKRAAELKINFAHIGGTTLNNKLGGNPSYGTNWRKPFSDSEINKIKHVIEKLRKNFIDASFSFSPRGTPPLCYSSEDEINIIVNKMKILYELGCRHFGLNFDDLQNVGQEGLICRDDIKIFNNDIGKAHYYFSKEVYQRLKKKHKDIKFRVLPLFYGSLNRMNDKQKDYLRTLGKLPKEIEFTHCLYTEKEILDYVKLTRRKPFIWDNYFTGWQKHKNIPFILPPFEGRASSLDNKKIDGYMFLLIIPYREDGSLSSWMTAADYMWSPERYEPKDSIQRVVTKVVGQKAQGVLHEYSGFMTKIREYYLPTRTGQERQRYTQDTLDKLNRWLPKLKAAVPSELFKTMRKELDGYIEDYRLILEDQSNKPFPLKVKLTHKPPIIDGKLDDECWQDKEAITGFLLLRKGLSKAKEQTIARLAYDKENLYLGVTCSESNMNKIKATHKKRDSNVYGDDCIEVFLDSEKKGEKYYHIVVNSIGTIYDAINLRRDWQGSYEIGTKINKDSWTLEMAIALKSISISEIKAGDRWNFNICRERRVEPKEYSSYALLLRSGFHTPARFWTIEFE